MSTAMCATSLCTLGGSEGFQDLGEGRQCQRLCVRLLCVHWEGGGGCERSGGEGGEEAGAATRRW